MKKKKLFLLASLAALAMTSCSSFDEPAALDGDGMPLTRSGERAVTRVESQEDLEDALADKASAIYIASSFNLTQSVTIISAFRPPLSATKVGLATHSVLRPAPVPPSPALSSRSSSGLSCPFQTGFPFSRRTVPVPSSPHRCPQSGSVSPV